MDEALFGLGACRLRVRLGWGELARSLQKFLRAFERPLLLLRKVQGCDVCILAAAAFGKDLLEDGRGVGAAVEKERVAALWRDLVEFLLFCDEMDLLGLAAIAV